LASPVSRILKTLRLRPNGKAALGAPSAAEEAQIVPRLMDVPANDPLIGYILANPGVIDIDQLDFESEGVQAFRAAGVQIVAPLIHQGQVVGFLNLGPRLSEQEYSSDDRRLLSILASQAAPAVRVAQLVQQQRAEARERERLEQEMRVARVIQQTLLPQEHPDLPGWDISGHYQPARAVGGDFYDYLYLQDGRLGVVIGDVTDKGVPAALVMATTRSMLRSLALQAADPGDVLAMVNDMLNQEIPPNMFVTCLYGILEPASGRFTYANAGHCLPILRTAQGTQELRARGMPLGLMPGMTYEEKEARIGPGEAVLFYSDGLVEAHNPRNEMYGTPRLLQELASPSQPRRGSALFECLLEELADFTGPDWQQEDDVAMILLERLQETP